MAEEVPCFTTPFLEIGRQIRWGLGRLQSDRIRNSVKPTQELNYLRLFFSASNLQQGMEGKSYCYHHEKCFLRSCCSYCSIYHELSKKDVMRTSKPKA
ncbi:hypothetical protein Pyn_03690 [Prunus yedoensis var. nudiflora]|uniref:Uncharacterized protein n=1 Tax=Prunus yedoensis var. nudiflora TaxID=2094558 RepID=A0A314XQW4_PRUYE|nr:hypothetical protein Pyn_03690 [Prunus yedoensis var. nudiflora]